MADHEARSWTSWHHCMSLVALASLYTALTRKDVNKEMPELTLDMAVRLLQAALQRRELSFEVAQELVRYHLDRTGKRLTTRHGSPSTSKRTPQVVL